MGQYLYRKYNNQRAAQCTMGKLDNNNDQSDVIYQTFLFPTKMDFDKNVALALAQSEDAINRLQIDKALLSTSDLAKDEF